ncbi:MAG: DUF3575 domain-containing protein [Mediterranea sp.]|nr:DUF3575 domain-containing protein [Mediterranea sp.]
MKRGWLLACLLWMGGMALASEAGNVVVRPELSHSYLDSLYIDVLRHGKVELGYLFYFPGKVSVPDGMRQSPLLTSRLDTFFGQTLGDSLIRFTAAEIRGSASVEGDYWLNERLSQKRAASLRDFLNERYHLSDHFPVTINWIGEDWDGLIACIKGTSLQELPQRDELLRIIADRSVQRNRESAIKRLDGGIPYLYIKKRFFQLQRRAAVTLTCDVRRLVEQKVGHELSDKEVERVVASAFLSPAQAERFLADSTLTHLPADIPADGFEARLQKTLETMYVPVKELTDKPAPSRPGRPLSSLDNTKEGVGHKTQPSAMPPYRPHWEVSTNLLALAGLTPEPAYRSPMPNLEIRYLFSRRFNLGLSALYKGAFKSAGYDVWHVTAYTLEGRYYLWPDAHDGGLFAGLYGRLGDYNFRRTADNRTGKYQEGGLTLGYTLPLSTHWILEAGAAGGYRHAQVLIYDHEGEEEDYLDTKTQHNTFDLTDLFFRIGYRF